MASPHGAEAHRPSPLPRIATKRHPPLRRKRPRRPYDASGATVAGEAWVALPYRRGAFGEAYATPAPAPLSAFPVKLTYRDIPGSIRRTLPRRPFRVNFRVVDRSEIG